LRKNKKGDREGGMVVRVVRVETNRFQRPFVILPAGTPEGAYHFLIIDNDEYVIIMTKKKRGKG